ncbi:24462_t:CDS:2 [Cetraspora pellucida]|uniref:24462_t:CDS:1 n=1 Tax=Cetraspora pellucida TaxID=1433469 RepID=A0A9N9NAL0_9GLOM|nr:24462_t:CDS:2 [Cetraspora pellucida]
MSSQSQIPSNNPMSSFHPNPYLDIALTNSPPKNISVKLSLTYPPLPHDNIDDNQDCQSQASSSSYIKFRFFQTDSKDDIKQEIAKAFDVQEFSLIDENDNIITASWFSLEDNQRYKIIDRSFIYKSFDDCTSENRFFMLNNGKKSVIYEKKRDRDSYRSNKKFSSSRLNRVIKLNMWEAGLQS